ncbi:MAG: phosphoglycerate dehydrogenase [Methylomonas sp.]|nr:phosphoglycerate dehydrogenase [Methylomonas sp.]PPD21213.1 MAG: phosphoglycerate dehydrogenase [Methylomonas sp.]PPD27680.1 MAG: phosphoglycerate dehydrogenase [Methylomonas sp.]PPD37881.1 MAG: phosphoglycerate dehydrogenase [Methylomonas sp.]PPD39665.1 MAG: phosphoglycerate dehydrogenase [Methylomonas sp.]
MKKILISDKLAEDGINFLNEQDDIHIHIQTGLSEDELCEIIADYDALLIRSDTQVTERVLCAAKRLKVVGRAGIGVDNVDLDVAMEQGVIVMNTPDANATTTAELAIAHILSMSRNLPVANQSVREGKWERSKLMGAEINHKTLAVLGFGTIGRIVASRGKGLGMRVIAYDPFVAPDIFENHGAEMVDLDTLLKQADYLTLHCPLLEKTRNIIGREQLALMKKSARLINCARGGLVDEAALYQALKDGRIAGAALDVYENEPPTDSPLLALNNIVFTPHLGASTKEAQVAVSVEIARQVVKYLQTGEAVNALNMPRLSADELRLAQPFMNLAHILGKVLFGLLDQPVLKLEVAVFGKAAQAKIRPISTEAMVGLLEGQFSTPVNRVNVDSIAKRQGLVLIESQSDASEGYQSLIKITGHCAQGSTSLVGTLLGDHHPRLVAVNHFEIEVVPQGTLLITRHEDRPGVIASICAILGAADINITRMQVGIADENQLSMMVISVSDPLDDDVLEGVCELSAVHSARQIVL